MIYLQLFWSFIQVGLFSFGGGLAALPLIQAQVVDHHHWLTMAEFTDLLAFSEMTPGPISINTATFVGIRTAGLLGGGIATLAFVLPPFIIVSLLAWLVSKYREVKAVQGILSGIRPAAIGLIASAGLTILVLAVWGEAGFSIDIANINFVAVVLFAFCLVILRWKKPSPILVMLLAGVVGGTIYLFF